MHRLDGAYNLKTINTVEDTVLYKDAILFLFFYFIKVV